MFSFKHARVRRARISGISTERRVWGSRIMSHCEAYVNQRAATGRARGGFKARFPDGRRIQGKIPCGWRRIYPVALLRRCSERVHLAIVVGGGGRQGWGAGRQAKTLQNLFCRIGRMNCGKNLHPATAAFTLKNIHQENPFHQFRPSIVALGRSRRFQRCGRSVNIRCCGLFKQKPWAGIGFGEIFINSWNDQWSPCGRRAKNPMIAGEVSARRGYQDRKFGYEILPLENHSGGSVS
jgi:hypothetical protein